MDNIYTVKEAAKILGFSTNTIYKYLEEGKIKAARGQEQGRYRIPKQSLEAFLGQPLDTNPLISTPTNPSTSTSITFPLKLVRLLLIFSLALIIADLATNPQISILTQTLRIITVSIFFVLAYQFGGFSPKKNSSKQANT